MKILVQISRVIVGVLFIFSGLVKANDPMGLSYKMQEFFEVWGIRELNDFTLMFALIINGIEIVAGVALLLGWRIKMFVWILLALIIFFTFLTGYALFSGKIKTCGCFGDCLPLTPAQSFWKDILLMLLIVVLLVGRNYIRPLLPGMLNGLLVFLAVLFSIAAQWYVSHHLPVVDCLPYKKGNNLLKQMQVPEGALPDSFAITFRYRKDGKEVAFDMKNFPADFDEEKYEFIDRNQTLVRPATGKAAITDFVLRDTAGNDVTADILNQNRRYILLFVQDATTAQNNWIQNATAVANSAAGKGIPVYVVTATLRQVQSQLFNVKNIQVLMGDATVIKTAARVNPSYILMEGAVVKGKWANADFGALLEVIK